MVIEAASLRIHGMRKHHRHFAFHRDSHFDDMITIHQGGNQAQCWSDTMTGE